MNKVSGIVIFFTLLSLMSLVASAQESATQELTGADQSAGYPYAGGKGPGMGRGYQQAAPGPGRGNGDRPGIPAAGVTADQAAAASDEGRYPYPERQQYPGRRGYGLGYPYAGQDAYPYRGRGAGYGQGRRGYGYGYPGYRGRGGTGYPGHRQYGNPPFYRTGDTE